ncbi:hypothetical protein K8R03_03385 [Candidatus Kaiserbacteria bacterium]|nr:hypothetical protein [Candidatus Kaiserbacteria bacterium]
MKTLHRAVLIAPALMMLLPFAAYAHETQVFEINHSLYKFVIGSLNEPVMVDDKTGVDLRVSKVSGHEMPDGTMMAGMSHGGTYTSETPVEGLEKTLQVELKTGSASKTLPLATVYGSVGAYKAPFYPTAPAQLTYRIFGTLEGNPVDVSFTCNPAGHSMTAQEADTTRVDQGGGVTRISKIGAFGCPAARDDVGFPESAPSLAALQKDASKTASHSTIALTLSAVALALSVIRFRRR